MAELYAVSVSVIRTSTVHPMITSRWWRQVYDELVNLTHVQLVTILGMHDFVSNRHICMYFYHTLTLATFRTKPNSNYYNIKSQHLLK